MPGESLFNVMLSGFIVDGFAKSLVIVELSELMKVSEEEAESYLKGNKKIIKTKVDAETAKKYHRMYTSKGVDIVVERVVEPPRAEAGRPAKPVNPTTQNVSGGAKSVAPQTSGSQKKASSAPSASQTVKPPVNRTKSPQPATPTSRVGAKATTPVDRAPAKRTVTTEPDHSGSKISIADAFSEEVTNPPPSFADKIKLFSTAAGVSAVVGFYGFILVAILLFVFARFYHMMADLLSLGISSVIAFYLLPIVVAIISFVFLLRPLFPRNERGENWFSLDAAKEKTFIRFVQHISGLVGAVKPENVNIISDVNAFVDFEGGIKGVKHGRLELWIGIPLIISLSARQLAGIVAREFSRFNHGQFSIVAYLIRDVNIRLHRSVHNQDGWEQWLEKKAEQSRIWHFLVKPINFFARVTGSVLKAFLFAINAVSANYLRQREFDADYYHVLFSGTNAFASAFKVSYFAEFAMDDFRNNIIAGDAGSRLVNDLPALVFHNINALDDETIKYLEDDMMLASTQWTDTIPSKRDRIMQAEDLSLPGITSLDIPAYRLLRDLKKVCFRATTAYYREHNIAFDPHQLVDVKEVAISSNEEKLRNDLCQQYYNGWFAPDVFWKVDQLTYARSLQLHQRKKEINELIAKIRRRTPDFGQLKQSLPQLFSGVVRLRLAVEIQKGGYPLDLAAFGLEGVQPGNVQRIYKDAQMEYDDVATQQHSLGEMMGLRLCLAVAFLNDASDRKMAQYLIDALGCLYKYAQKMTELRIHVVLIPQYLQRVEKHKETEHKKRLRRIAKEIQDLSKNLVEELRGYDWPFDKKYNNLAEYFLSWVTHPLSDGDSSISDKARVYESLWNALCRTNTYLNGQIAPIAQKAEKDNRIEPVKITTPARS